MTLRYPVSPGTILLCDYSSGFRPPEMIKRRLAIVISPRLPHRNGLCTVVPLSLTPPDPVVSYQVEIEFEDELPTPWRGRTRWAKADMLATVSFERLDLLRTQRVQGRRSYLQIRINSDELAKVYRAVLCALGLQALTPHL